jgi:hypothetical protein
MIRWVWAFLDRPADRVAETARFWCSATGSTLSPWRGAADEFATFLPLQGDAYLKIQAVASTGGGHLDLEVPDVRYAVSRATELGARVLADHGVWAVLASAAGIRLCVVPWKDRSVRPEPVTHPGGGRSRLDQVCLDVGPTEHAAELGFWAGLTGWDLVTGALPEFTVLRPPAGMPVRLLVQRLETDRPAGVHVDLACSDVGELTAYHESLGAHVVAQRRFWTVMRDPAAGTYCLTARDPDTGRLCTG